MILLLPAPSLIFSAASIHLSVTSLKNLEDWKPGNPATEGKSCTLPDFRGNPVLACETRLFKEYYDL
ncbi:hypothetical protein GJAV_G00102690 [Gymnothorax javanicus]|nr:hypothetical protein GJAV_G00102690 [Gymnothorax javanicus]